jgi:predicted acylesterase/phospholipase RssA
VNRTFFFLPIFLLLLLPACAHVPPAPTAGCRLNAYPLLVSPNHPHAFGEPPRIDEVLSEALRPRPGTPSGLPEVLVLSGGSQHGAFGAGFFRGLAAVPDYRVVTGVSTGSLQSTFLFLANHAPPTDRLYQPFMRGQAVAPGTSNIDDLFLAYSISKESDLVDIGSFGEAGGVIRGSIGRFEPLRAAASGLISDQTIRAVGEEGTKNHRLLMVGVVDVIDGQGYAIDLTELAGRALTGEMPMAQIRHCYVDALVASSSVPLAVPPVSLETKVKDGVAHDLYIDGGARFGVFWEQLREITDTKRPANVTAIVNGSLYGDPWTSKGRPVEKWSALNLGMRAVSILENQVYRFSVDEVERSVQPGGTLRLAFISNECRPKERPGCADGLLPSEGEPNDFDFQQAGAKHNCGDWSKEDDRLTKPTEFHPFYMRCLLAYGRHRGEGPLWNLVLPVAAAAPGSGTGD